MANSKHIEGSKLYLKCLGALAGGVIGDAMGAPSEGNSPARSRAGSAGWTILNRAAPTTRSYAMSWPEP